jgi:hypothetical protein
VLYSSFIQFYIASNLNYFKPCQNFFINFAENLLKGSIATEVESRKSWSDREFDRDRPRDSVVQFPDDFDEKDSDDDVSHTFFNIFRTEFFHLRICFSFYLNYIP